MVLRNPLPSSSEPFSLVSRVRAAIILDYGARGGESIAGVAAQSAH